MIPVHGNLTFGANCPPISTLKNTTSLALVMSIMKYIYHFRQVLWSLIYFSVVCDLVHCSYVGTFPDYVKV